MGKRLPQLYYIRMKISYDLGVIAIKVAMATSCRYYVYFYLCFSALGFFFLRDRLREYVPTCHNCLNYGKVSTNSIRAFWKYFETKF